MGTWERKVLYLEGKVLEPAGKLARLFSIVRSVGTPLIWVLLCCILRGRKNAFTHAKTEDNEKSGARGKRF